MLEFKNIPKINPDIIHGILGTLNESDLSAEILQKTLEDFKQENIVLYNIYALMNNICRDSREFKIMMCGVFYTLLVIDRQIEVDNMEKYIE